MTGSRTTNWRAPHGLPLSPGTRGPATDGAFRTAEPGVFAVGNVLRGVEPAPVAAAEGRDVATSVRERLDGGPWPVTGVPVVTEGPLRWVSPGLLGPVAVPLLVRPERPLVRPVLTVAQGGSALRRERLSGSLAPWRSVRLPAHWTSGVDPERGPVVISAEA